MAYKHGIYTENLSTVGSLAIRAVGTVPVYIGTAPIDKTSGKVGKVNEPILISSYSDFVAKMGESDNWGDYTLCEVAYAHFKNNVRAVAPFIVINMLDVSTDVTGEKSASVTLTNKVGYLDNANDKIIASSISSTELGTSFTYEYTSDKKIKITYTGTGSVPSATVNYKEVDITKINGTKFANALNALDLAEMKCGVVPNIIVAPKFSAVAANATALINKCIAKIDEKWACVAYIDIPTDSVTTLEQAKSYKTTNSLNSKYARLHFPKAKYNNKVFHLSVLDAVATQVVDTETDGVACRSSSNKQISCDVPVLDSTTNLTYSEKSANGLNEKGITTINYIGGSYRLWGGHMANYDYANIASIEAKDRSDATIRMQVYLDNWLKREHIDNIDTPLTRRDIDNIISNVNIGLNSFVNSGYLLKGECYFDDGDNATGELADGNLVLDVLHTEVPNGKSVTFQLQYDVSGLDTLYAVEEA